MDPKQLHRHIHSTYLSLRLGMGVVAFMFPILLWGIGRYFGIKLQSSMSIYYHTDVRDIFVGCLFSIGTFLYLYKGFSKKENVALNVAGFSAIGGALFPTDHPNELAAAFEKPVIHAICAVLMFLLISYVCIFRAEDTLRLMKDEKRRARYRHLYRWLGLTMIVLPVLVAILVFQFGMGRGEGKSPVLFALEVVAIWVFALFWVIKSREIYVTEKRDLDGADCGSII